MPLHADDYGCSYIRGSSTEIRVEESMERKVCEEGKTARKEQSPSQVYLGRHEGHRNRDK